MIATLVQRQSNLVENISHFSGGLHDNGSVGRNDSISISISISIIIVVLNNSSSLFLLWKRGTIILDLQTVVVVPATSRCG
jgi:hypothetical protein